MTLIVNKPPDELVWPEDFINRVICGDCLEILPHIPDGVIDAVITDPPYGIGRDKGFKGLGGFGGVGPPIARTRYEGNWDSATPSGAAFDLMLLKCNIALIFGGNFFTDKLPQSDHWLFWDKLNTMPTFGDGELIWSNIDRHSVKKIVHEYNGLIGKEDQRRHATQKPLRLMRDLIDKYTEPGELILDPYAGSGSTLVAAKQLGRKFIGIDINPDYCTIAEDRLRQEELF